MEIVKDIVLRHLKDPTTYAGLATLLATYLPTSITGISASQWEQVIGLIVGAVLVWIDGRVKGGQAISPRSSQKGFGRINAVCVLSIGGAAAASILVFGCASVNSPKFHDTIEASCAAVAGLNTAFQTFAAQHPGVIDANGMSTEGAVMTSVGLPVDGQSPPIPGSICAPPYAVTLAVAETTLISASLNIASLLATWQK